MTIIVNTIIGCTRQQIHYSKLAMEGRFQEAGPLRTWRYPNGVAARHGHFSERDAQEGQQTRSRERFQVECYL